MSTAHDHDEQAARETLVVTATHMLRGHPASPNGTTERRLLAEQIVTVWMALPGLRSILQAYIDQVRRIWEVLASTMAAHPTLCDYTIRRGVLLQARLQHHSEGTPEWITGERAPSGCRVCGRPTHTLLFDPPPLGPGQRTVLRGHVFDPPPLGPGRWRDRVEANAHVLEQMRNRRHQRATWFFDRGFDPCGECGTTSKHHPKEHRIYETPHNDPTFDPWGPVDPRYVRTGPYVAPTDDQILDHVARARAERWHHLYPDLWIDGWEEAGRDEVMAGLSDLERAVAEGLDLDDE
ncbi:hypothetical protein ACWFMI_23835 [Nocardiopsis terrae]|uniref:hypothetical protein n=1 Tax=Streptomyces sp. NPDC057554 TaxID=3350538 RepID=UPI0036B912D0